MNNKLLYLDTKNRKLLRLREQMSRTDELLDKAYAAINRKPPSTLHGRVLGKL